MKKATRRLLRRLAKKGTSWEGARRKLTASAELSKKELREAKTYYEEKVQSFASKPQTSRRKRRRQCKHAFPWKRDEQGNYILNEDTGEHELEPCTYCGMTWEEVRGKKKQLPEKVQLPDKLVARIDGQRTVFKKVRGKWCSRTRKEEDWLPVPPSLNSDVEIVKLIEANPVRRRRK